MPIYPSRPGLVARSAFVANNQKNPHHQIAGFCFGVLNLD